MIRYIQRSKRKKGFTLVEVIVVMAIIGVLAAIILPVMLGYVTQAKITSANASATLIRKNVESFMMELNFKGVGLKLGDDRIAQIILMVKDGKWTAKAESKPWDQKKNKKIADSDGSYVFQDHKNWWKASQNFVLTDDITRADKNHLLALTRVVSDVVPDLKNGFVMIFFRNQRCDGVIYIPECTYVWPGTYGAGNGTMRPCIVNDPNDKNRPGMTEYWQYKGSWPSGATKKIWVTGTPGIDKDGFIVGTAPVIGIKEG